MKKLSIILSALVVVSSFTFLDNVWMNDDPHSQVKFTVTHLGIADVSGTFNDFDAKITSSKPDFSDGVFEMTAKVNSIDTRVDARNKHLKSPDFFDAEKFPALSFKSTSLKKAGKNKFKLTGDLTLHGITKPVTLLLQHRGTVEHPQKKKPTAGFKVTGTINRSDFNLGSTFPEAMISNVVRIEADGEFAQ